MSKPKRLKTQPVNSNEMISDYSFYLQLIVEENELDCETDSKI
ncbi:MAG: hypothetical protein WD577_05085 [Bacteroidales bacterium]